MVAAFGGHLRVICPLPSWLPISWGKPGPFNDPLIYLRTTVTRLDGNSVPTVTISHGWPRDPRRFEAVPCACWWTWLSSLELFIEDGLIIQLPFVRASSYKSPCHLPSEPRPNSSTSLRRSCLPVALLFLQILISRLLRPMPPRVASSLSWTTIAGWKMVSGTLYL